jgi:hypothetical protein
MPPELDIGAANVTIKDSTIISNSGMLGQAANGTADILVDDGASAVIDHVKINGDNGVHACVWASGHTADRRCSELLRRGRRREF